MNQYNPLVSIVIPVYNGSNYMREAIESALAQTYKNIEIIVVNDGSTDNTEEIALSYGDKVRYFSKENGGVATALNLAIQKAKGEYISWLSHDDLYLPNKIQRQIDELNRLDNKNTILYSNWTYIDPNNRVICNVLLEQSYNPKWLNISLYPLIIGMFHGCTLLVKKEIFEEFGYFKTDLLTTQDYDLWFDVLRKYPIKHIPEVLIKSRDHFEQGSKSLGYIHTIEGNKLWCKIIDNLTNEEIRQMSESNINFFKKLSDRLGLLGLQKASRRALLRAFTDNNKKNILIFTAMKTGGLGRFVYDLSGNFAKDYNVFILYANMQTVEIIINNEVLFSFKLSTPVYFDDMFSETELSNIIKQLIPILDIDIVHINGFLLIGFAVLEAIKSFNVPIVYTVHDFQTLCLSQHFLDKESKFCNFNKDLEICYKCLENNPYVSWLEMQNTKKIKIYREFVNKFVLPELDRIVFPSSFVKDTFSNYLEKLFDELKYEIIEHGISHNNGDDSEISFENIENNKLRIGIIGHIAGHKGLTALKQITSEVDRNRFEFILFGSVIEKLENTRIIGEYNYDNAVDLLKSYNLSAVLILSEAPETFSYVLSECWLAEIPPIVTGIGALKQRVESTDAGWVVNVNNTVQDVKNLLNNLYNTPSLIQKKKNLVNTIKIQSLENMAEKYNVLYQNLLKDKKKIEFLNEIRDIIISNLFKQIKLQEKR